MNDAPDRPKRSFNWLWVLFGLGLVATPVVLVTGALRRTRDERPFVGTWSSRHQSTTITFRSDGTGSSNHVDLFRWSARDGRLRGSSELTWGDYLRHRVLGTEFEGEEYRIVEAGPRRIVLEDDEDPETGRISLTR